MELYLRETPKERKKAAYESALAVLSHGKNRVFLTVAALACIAVSFVCYFVLWAASLIFYDAAVGNASFLVWFATEALFVLLLWLLAAPLWLGMYRMAHGMMCGKTTDMGDFFAYIGDARMYLRSLRMSWRLLVRWLPVWVGYLAFQMFFAYDIVGVLLVVFLMIASVLSLALVSGIGGFLTLAVSDDKMSLVDAAERSCELIAGERMRVLGYDLLMFLRLALSLVPIGIPFLLQMLPLSMLCAAAYSERLAAREM